MKTLYAVSLVIIASFGLGILAGQSLAQIAPPNTGAVQPKARSIADRKSPV